MMSSPGSGQSNTATILCISPTSWGYLVHINSYFNNFHYALWCHSNNIIGLCFHEDDLFDHIQSYSKLINKHSLIACYDVTCWHINRIPFFCAYAINTTTNIINKRHNIFSLGYKISALVASWHSDSSKSCSCLISNYSTALVQEEQECNWQRWWL